MPPRFCDDERAFHDFVGRDFVWTSTTAYASEVAITPFIAATK